nr:uncharacterized protein LOC127341301 isoform X2 [Lolium perenne]
MDGSTRNSPLFASPRSGMEPPWSTLHRCILPGTGEALKRRACPRLRRASAMVTVHIFIDPGVASRPRAFPFAYAPPAFASSRIGSRSGVVRYDKFSGCSSASFNRYEDMFDEDDVSKGYPSGLAWAGLWTPLGYLQDS